MAVEENEKAVVGATFERDFLYDKPYPQNPMFEGERVQTIFPSTHVFQDNGTFRWRPAVADYQFPYDLYSLMIMPKLHDVSTIKFGLDHAEVLTTYAGHEERTRYCQENRFSVTYLWEAVDHSVREEIRHFHCDYVQGKLKEFWMPLWLEEFACTNGIQAGSNTVRMYPNGLRRVFPNWMKPDLGWNGQALFVRKKNGDQYVRPIEGCSDDSAITLTSPFPIDIPYKDIFMVSRVHRWTFASGLTENWISNINRLDRSGRAIEISASFQVVSGVEDKKGCIVGIDFEDHHLPW